jgi:hypothetical protein
MHTTGQAKVSRKISDRWASPYGSARWPAPLRPATRWAAAQRIAAELTHLRLMVAANVSL